MRVSSGILKWKMKSRLRLIHSIDALQKIMHIAIVVTYVCVFFNKLLRVAFSATFLVYQVMVCSVVDIRWHWQYNCIQFSVLFCSWSRQYNTVCFFLRILLN